MKNIINKILLFIFLSQNFALAQNNFSFKKLLDKNNYSEKRELQINIYKDGIEQYQFKKVLVAYQSIPQILILDSNKFCLTFSQEGLVEFYENNQIQNLHYFYKSHQQNEQSIISANNKSSLAILVSENHQNKIYLFNHNGESQDSFDVEGGIVSGLSISNYSELIAASYYKWENDNLKNQTLILNRTNGNSFFINDKFSTGKFKDDGKLFLGFTNKNSFCFDLENNKLLWNETLLDNEIYLDGIWANENSILIKSKNAEFLNGSWVYHDAEIFSKTKSGEKRILNKLNSSFRKLTFKNTNYTLKLNIDGNLIELDRQTN
ncbi:MAG: PQQ-like beta-propeller repeat protein [Ignavibacteriae bacterium]|nr:PQQ-like beta-propeller repeat protein [Ignavibacteriota bacterium]